MGKKNWPAAPSRRGETRRGSDGQALFGVGEKKIQCRVQLMLGCSQVARCAIEGTLFLEETVDEGRVSGPLFGAVIAGAFFSPKLCWRFARPV